jgi:UDP-glucose 4-epimerase
MKYIVTGGAGFIGSHLVDKLIELKHDVIIIDNMLTGKIYNINKNATFIYGDITNMDIINTIFDNTINGVFHLAAIARTPWCIKNPLLTYETNVKGSLNILECCRQKNIPRIVLTSSNVVYGKHTPYRSSKEAMESLAQVYKETYNMSTICLRNSNVYGTRQNMDEFSPSVFASFKKSKMVNGFIEITGDGNQSSDFTHVSDIVDGHIQAMNSTYCGIVDLCTGVNTTLNEIGNFFECPVHYIPERISDVKHIYQDPTLAKKHLNWESKIPLHTGMMDLFEEDKKKLTIMTGIYNEEKLLPFWIEHHKKLQDKGIIHNVIVIDHNSTDESMNIIKKTCPNWIIVNTKTTCFDAAAVDIEIMEYEKNIPGYKLFLNTTEFLMCDDISSILHTEQPLCYYINNETLLAREKYYSPTDFNDLIHNTRYKINGYREPRYLHSYTTGKYEVGRHKTGHTLTHHNISLYIIWVGMYSLSDVFLDRKLQIKHRIPESDRIAGASFQHFWDRERIEKEYNYLVLSCELYAS